jgi:multidrug resistance efflux pump
MKSKLFYIFIILAAGSLLVVSFLSVNKKEAIVAVVESQKTAISYRKPVTVKSIYVNAGQQVKKGDLLLEVDRPDLSFENEKLLNQKEKTIKEKDVLQSSYRSKIDLLKIEEEGKIQRLDAEIEQLESKMKLNQALRDNLSALSSNRTDTTDPNLMDPDSLIWQSLHNQKEQIEQLYSSDRKRLAINLKENISLTELEIELIEREIGELQVERDQLKKYAPFSGTVGNINAQLDEIVAPYQTIISLYELQPSLIKAFINVSSQYVVEPGDNVLIESSTRDYNTAGKVLEIGARIVGYQDPSRPLNAPELLGREIFIELPEENSFLYGEQVFVYPTVK